MSARHRFNAWITGGALGLACGLWWLPVYGPGLTALFGLVYLLATDWWLMMLMDPREESETRWSRPAVKLLVGLPPLALSAAWISVIVIHGDTAWMALPLAFVPAVMVLPFLVMSLLMPPPSD